MKSPLLFKKAVALGLLLTFLSAVSAQTLKNNSVYRITSYSTQGALGVVNSSQDQNADVVSYATSGSNSQCWKVTYNPTDQTYTFTNPGSDKNMYLYANQAGINVKQGSFIFTGGDKWKISSVSNPDYPDCFYIHNFLQTADKKRLYVEIPVFDPISGSEGLVVKSGIDPENGTIEPRRCWKFTEVEEKANAPTPESVNATIQSFKAKYYKLAAYGYVLGAPGFWNVAEMMEILLDAYETTGKAEYKSMFYNVYDNFYKTQGNKNGDWMNNPFNDDIAWIVIACTRAYILFKDIKFLNIAKSHFDRMYARSLLNHGGLRWKEGTGDGSNSCINGPAQVAAMYLAKALSDTTYYTKAKRIYDYQYRVLYDKNSGRVYDSALGETVTNTWASTYNQGTFIGANLMLYEYFKDPSYLTVAAKVASYTMNTMYNGKVMNNESGRDLDGFKGILMRYMRKYIVDYNKPNLIPWLHLNAKVAYNNRNSEGIIGTLWGTKTPETYQDVFAASTAVSLMVNTPLTLSVEKDPFAIVQAEDFDYISGPIAENCPEGTENLGNIQNNYYVGYMNVDFGAKVANRAEFRVSSVNSGGLIEVRLGSPSGQLIGTATIPATTDWKSYVTISCDIAPVTGLQHLYLVFKGADYIANLNWFYFREMNTSVEKVSTTNFFIFPNIIKRGDNLSFHCSETDLVQIFSVNGSVVFESRPQNKYTISTSDMNPGTYLFRLISGKDIRQSYFMVK